jgi:hypothetical protein
MMHEGMRPAEDELVKRAVAQMPLMSDDAFAAGRIALLAKVHADEAREARCLLGTALETVPADPATAGDGLLRAVRCRYARRRRSRAFLSAGAAAAAAGTAAAVLLSVTVAAAPPALAAVSGALSRAAAGSFRMNLFVTEHDTVPGLGPIQPPLRMTGELDLKRNLGEETLSYGWRTLIVGGWTYTQLPPAQAKIDGTGGKLWTEELLGDDTAPPYRSAGAQLAWDFNSDRPFNPQALLALLRSGARVLDEGPVSGPGWTGTRYAFTVSHPEGTRGLVDSITCTVDVDGHGHIRGFAQETVFATSKPAGEMIYTADFTFSDFGIRFSVTPPPASQIDPDIGVAVQF